MLLASCFPGSGSLVSGSTCSSSASGRSGDTCRCLGSSVSSCRLGPVCVGSGRCFTSRGSLARWTLWRPRIPGPRVTAGRPAEEDSRPGRAATAAAAAVLAAAAAGRENGTGPPSSATYVWTLPGTLWSVCAATCSGTSRGRGPLDGGLFVFSTGGPECSLAVWSASFCRHLDSSDRSEHTHGSIWTKPVDITCVCAVGGGRMEADHI